MTDAPELWKFWHIRSVHATAVSRARRRERGRLTTLPPRASLRTGAGVAEAAVASVFLRARRRRGYASVRCPHVAGSPTRSERYATPKYYSRGRRGRGGGTRAPPGPGSVFGACTAGRVRFASARRMRRARAGSAVPEQKVLISTSTPTRGRGRGRIHTLEPPSRVDRDAPCSVYPPGEMGGPEGYLRFPGFR